jgi:hypothetical protein
VTDSNSAFDYPLPSPEAAETHIIHCLALLIGRGKRFSVNDVSIGTGIPERTVSSWLETHDPREPKAKHLLLLCGFFGTEWTSKVLGPVGQVSQPIRSADAIRPADILVGVLSDLSVIGKAASDNRIDHTEEPACREAADRIIAAMVPISSVGRPN